jgi:hypothetical protein
MLAVLRDATERKRAERKLRESREQLRRSSASMQVVREEETPALRELAREPEHCAAIDRPAATTAARNPAER